MSQADSNIDDTTTNFFNEIIESDNIYAINVLRNLVLKGYADSGRLANQLIPAIESSQFYPDLFRVRSNLGLPCRQVNRSPQRLYITDSIDYDEFIIMDLSPGWIQVQTFEDRALQRADDFGQTPTLLDSFNSVILRLNAMKIENIKTIFHGDRILVFNYNYSAMFFYFKMTGLSSRLMPAYTTTRYGKKSTLTVLKLCKHMLGN
jgi:hypothetical protein